MKKISVLMTVFNENPAMVKTAIYSILEQTYENIELIVVIDNPSNMEIINTLKEVDDKRLKVYINDTNIGLPMSLNRALQYASGEYVARMDADDESSRDRLAKQLNYLEEGKYDLVGCFVQFRHKGKAIKTLRFPTKMRNIIKYMRFASPISHATWLAKKEVFDTVGGYRDIFSVEDLDFLIRSSFRNVKMSNYDEVLYYVETTEESISRSNPGLQEATAHYLRREFKRGESPDMKEIRSFQSSKCFRNTVKRYDKYYRIKIARTNAKKRDKVKYLLNSIKLFLYLDVLAKDVYEKVRCKLIIKMDRI